MVRIELHGMSDETQREVRDDGEDIPDNRSPAGLVPAGEDAGVGVMEMRDDRLRDEVNKMVIDYTYPTQSTWQSRSMTMQIPLDAFGVLFETKLEENLRDEVNKVMTAPDVYRECADELRWLVNSLDKAADCMIKGEMIAGGVRLQRVLDRMQETERKWWRMAEETEESDE